MREAHRAIRNGREQMGFAIGEIRHAMEAYRLSNLRLEELGAEGAAPMTAEVVQTIRALGTAQLDGVSSINAYNKAQVRLRLLLVPCSAPERLSGAGR